MKFSGKNVLITGASKGIGAEIAKNLASYGLKVWINYRSKIEEAEAIKEQIEKAGGTAAIIKADVSIEDEFVNAIKTIIDKEFVLVYKNDKTISGIVTIADISSQFISVTEPFILLEQIENHIRQILNNKFLIADIKEFCKIDDFDRDIEFIDDLNFGDYIRIIGKPDNWEKLNLSIERSHFIKQLDKVRQIRNDIMHFDPEGITREQREDLTKMAKFLMELKKYN